MLQRARSLCLLFLSWACLPCAVTRSVQADPQADSRERPNILWLTSEDNGPHLGCYGDAYADTPHIDALAKRSLLYLHCWSNAPVCAPARTTLISGLYPPSTGAEHMRSMTRLPRDFQMYPQILRKAGYYCTNNSKEDYNLKKNGSVWNDSSRKAHWKNRSPQQPFFAIFNYTTSHESQLRKRPHRPIHDPDKVRVPAYHPDTEEVRRDWAQYYDKITEMDQQVGNALQEIEAAGLTEETIVFYYGDHGSGMPRNKRWPYNSGLHVPLVVHIPQKFRHLAAPDYNVGGRADRLVSFVDFAPTLLSLIGVKPPAHFQGHAFLGPHATAPQLFIYGFRGRMDERTDLVRSVRDHRYVYIRNYMPHRPYGQYLSYMFQTPTTRVWHALFQQNQLTAVQSHFWKPKPTEELYDLQKDPDEVRNLAQSPDHREVLQRLRAAQKQLALQIRDVGFLPEDEVHNRSQDSSPYEMGHDDTTYPLAAILQMAEHASQIHHSQNQVDYELQLKAKDSAVRYWAAMGLLIQGQKAVQDHEAELQQALHDKSASVRVIAAEALGQYGNDLSSTQALHELVRLANLNNHGLYISIMALNALDHLNAKAAPVFPQLRDLPQKHPTVPGRLGNYVPRLLERIFTSAD